MEKGVIITYSVATQKKDKSWSIDSFVIEYENQVIVDTINIVHEMYQPKVLQGELLTFALLSAYHDYVGYTPEELTEEYAKLNVQPNEEVEESADLPDAEQVD